MKPKVEVETISEREHVLKVDGEIIGVSKTQYDALFHKHFLDRKFDEVFQGTSVVRSKAANGGQVKTGQRMWPGT
jgi:hypothetical protein